MIYIVKNKIHIEIKELRSVLDLFPKAVEFKTVVHKQFEVGSVNKTGHYNGLLGFVQRGEADIGKSNFAIILY